MVVFFTKINNENTYPKGRVLMQMYRVVPQTKRRNLYGGFNKVHMKYRRNTIWSVN